MNNREVKFQLDISSDVTLINEPIWKNRQTNSKTEKIALGITENKLKFVGECYTNLIFMGKSLKLKGFIMNQTQNLFSMDCIELFNLLN